MKNILILFFLLFISFLSVAQSNNPINKYTEPYLEGTVIFKLRPEYKNNLKSNNVIDNGLNDYLQKIETEYIIQKFPKSSTPTKKKNVLGQNYVDISLIYELHYSSKTPIEEVIKRLKACQYIEYAEPYFIPEPLYVPNDVLLTNQYYLNKIKAYEAWDVSKGDTSVIIGITDSGIDIMHEDLVGNIAYNWDDPINGIDDDNDGFVDNFRGYDVGNFDNNPQCPESQPHGVWVSGIAAAHTNNTLGIAGIGFNCKVLPIKVCNELGTFIRSYEGIVYAAEHNCAIINCSWGSRSYTLFGNDIVNYATVNRNCLVIGAAGNDGNAVPFFPASYNNVLSVASTNSYDIKSPNSSYGINVDLCAPGELMWTTGLNNSYFRVYFGTSFAAPVVAGCAGIVKSYFPNYSPYQITEILKAGADNIDTIPNNNAWKGGLGAGRVNLYNSLTLTKSIVDFINPQYFDFKDERFFANDTVFIYGDFINYLSPTKNFYAKIISNSPYLQILNDSVYIGVLNTMQPYYNKDHPFIIKIKSCSIIDFKLSYSILLYDSTSFNQKTFSFFINPSYINLDTNNIKTTITSIGKIGFKYWDMQEGIGFKYKNGLNMLLDAGLIIGSSPNKIACSIRDVQNFSVEKLVYKLDTPKVSDCDMLCRFFENSNLNITISQRTYAWNTQGNKDYIILEYDIVNNNPTTIYDLYIGLWLDWDILNPYYNSTNFNENLSLSYTYYKPDSSAFGGVQLLSKTPLKHYVIDDVQGGDGIIDITDGFTNSEKYYVISSNRHSTGGTTGTQVVDVMSTGPFIIQPSDTQHIAFALLASDNLDSLVKTATNAKKMYDSLHHINNINQLNNVPLSFKIYPNPVHNKLFLDINSLTNIPVNIMVFDFSGKSVTNISTYTYKNGVNNFTINTENFKSGIYLVSIKINNQVYSSKHIIIEK